jgi:hypothetical protein
VNVDEAWPCPSSIGGSLLAVFVVDSKDDPLTILDQK